MDLWITSLLPTGSTGLYCGYVDNLPVAHIPTALQSIKIGKGTENVATINTKV
jgi:hypothetical protein